ncbi:MAG: HDIG domain-containing protein [Planctomycetes bacterium]|nr:HDIG domain-containing protein [Planctomycetota bacterium]
MAFTELEEHKLEIIANRLGETESERSRINWQNWLPRIWGGLAFIILMMSVLLVPYDDLRPTRVLGLAMLTTMSVAGYGWLLLRLRPDLLVQGRRQLLFGASVLITSAILQSLGSVDTSELPYDMGTGVAPAALFGMMLLAGISYAVVFDQKFAAAGIIFLSLALVMVLHDKSFFRPVDMGISLIGVLAAVLQTRNFSSRYKLALVGLAGGITAALVILGLGLVGAGEYWDVPAQTAWMHILNWCIGAIVVGAAVGMFSTFQLPVFERIFGITTELRLIELKNSEHPLIDLMQQRAPGTWQHTQNVANFTSAACEAVGANALLGEVGVKFHDLGKMVRPEYFTENEPESKLLHDQLSPQMSAMIILSHVADGVLMARKYKLPAVIEDFITGHHGTSIIKYFYFKAKAVAVEGETVDPNQFRYPGPKPQIKESAIAAIADQVEATARSRFAGASFVPDDIRNMVHQSITDKMLDGQFDECDITLAEWKLVEDSLVASLSGMYHHRVKYPDDPDKDKRQAALEAREKYRRELAKRKERILTQ